MRMIRSLSLLALVLALAAPATASTFLDMSQREMLQQSGAVIQGEVLEVRSFWNDERTVILTEAMVEVREEIAGKADSTVVRVRTVGGVVGGYKIEAAGFPTFARGDRVVLFLDRGEQGVYEVVGYRLGQYRVTQNRDGVALAVPTLEHGVRLLTADGREARRPQTVELDELKSQIRNEARRIPRLQR